MLGIFLQCYSDSFPIEYLLEGIERFVLDLFIYLFIEGKD